MAEDGVLSLKGVSENNLKDLSLDLEHNRFIAITGVSGSGKSTLAFDTIYAEGGRRYIETFSPYTRQFLDRLHKPALDSIQGVRPALALEQANRTVNSRSTVGTITEINEYLKLLWARLAGIFCPNCGEEVKKDSTQSIIQNLNQEGAVYILAPIKVTGAATASAFRDTLLSEGFLRYYSDGEVKRIERLSDSEYSSLTDNFRIVLERFNLKRQITPKERRRLSAACAQAFEISHGSCHLVFKDGQERHYSKSLRCSACDIDFGSPRSSLFSFNSPIGACPECNGFGKTLAIDLDLIVPNPTLSIKDGAIAPWTTKATSYERKQLERHCKKQRISLDTPWEKLKKAEKESILDGDESFWGVYGWFEWLERKKYKMHVRVFLSRYRSQKTCETCGGSRLKEEALVYRVLDQTLPQVWSMPLSDLYALLHPLQAEYEDDPELLVVLNELCGRLYYLNKIGLGYITLDRQTRTLSGGEFQRVNLTSLLGAQLSNTTLVLDEPTIGLHSRDTDRLISVIKKLRERGNSLVVVEHDEAVIREADEIVDIGPESGEQGGEVVFRGTFSELTKAEGSYTAKYLGQAAKVSDSKKVFKHYLKVQGAREHNLKNIDVNIPLGGFTVLTGVSGSGKSTLVGPCLHEIHKKLKDGQRLTKADPLKALRGLDKLSDIICIDQSAVGKTPRSNPATYTKIWEHIRDCLASSEEAERLGLSRSAFSFNVDGGRCPDCKGSGSHRVEMQFLADVFVECESCGGTRFQEQVLGVRYRGKSVLDFLQMPLEECARFFADTAEDKHAREISKRIKPLVDLGLGYLRLGHPLNKLSGGEAQRLKLASYLSGECSGPSLFILDEPTTGLHPHNISSLISTFFTLIAQGHSVLCIEHNMDVIIQADWIIDLGPEGGAGGGQLVAEGNPKELLKNDAKSETIEYLRKHMSKRKKRASKTKIKTPIAGPKNIEILGARHHNLKNVSIEIPQEKIVVITGVSGSGKSSLAFDILFAEGQRRYIDCLSPYARQFIKQLERAEVDQVKALPPTVAISQKTSPPLGVSTIATTTEIYQYLRLLYCKVGTQLCPEHQCEISEFSSTSITEEIIKQFSGQQVYLLAPIVSGRKGFYNDLFRRALKAEIMEAKVDGKILSLSSDLRLERHKLHWISLLVGSIKVSKKKTELIKAAVEQCLLLGSGEIEIAVGAATADPLVLSKERSCPECKRGFRELDPQDFSFRSKRGLCEECSGRGTVTDKKGEEKECPICNGARIGSIGRNVLLGGKRIFELTNLRPLELSKFISKLSLPPRLDPIVTPIITELKARLKMLEEVGLGYLSLNRESSTVSGGEAQRLRLARTLGSPLTGVCYVLDEPTIGLHAEDHALVMNILQKLRKSGNSVVVVEHDEDTIRAADHIIDIGPGGGFQGGNLVAAGTPKELIACKQSLTGKALKDRSNTELSKGKKVEEQFTLTGASANNLKQITASFPIRQLSVVCGVSGAGKSSLVHSSLAPAVMASLQRKRSGKTWKSIKGLENIQRYIEIDQTPIGKTSSSTPASYLGIFNDIRAVYAMTPEAQARGWNAKHFSFNTGNGRCSACEGKGQLKVPMSFLPEASTTCEVCGGMRYNEESLEIEYLGHSIGSLLKRTLSEAFHILRNHKKIKRVLEYVIDLGLGYLTLGQASHTLSGGEAQRLKIAKELGSREAVESLYVLDEPTIGLHMIDVDRLIGVLRKLIDKGNTVIVIEHNLDFIRAADFLLEMGPQPGDRGGKIIYSGPPSRILKKQTPTARALLN